MSRYKINRMGFFNYWLYDEEEFYFYDGKLLLRGSNGSGKTVSMVSFFPLIFDGNKSPERLDTFGSRDRKIEDYVLPSDFEGNENTSYIYMEFYNKEIEKYLTIGIGLRAIKNKNVEFYGFAITDNRRIKQDFMLYKDRFRKIPLTKKELQNEIGAGGEFVTSQKEYKSMVNRLLFGFEQDSLYTELINLMLQLRSPKLSKEYKPTKLVEILSGVLEPLSESDITTVSESIENMNKYKEKIADLKEETKAARSLMESFYDYSNRVLYNKCDSYLKSQEELKEERDTKEKAVESIDILTKENESLATRQEEIKLELSDIAYKISNMDAKDLEKMVEEKKNLEESFEELTLKEENKANNLENKKDKEIDLKKQMDLANHKVYEILEEKKEIISDLEDNQEELYYDEVVFAMDEIKNNYQQFNFELFLSELEKEKEHLKSLSSIIETIETLNQKKEIEEEKILKNEGKTNEIQKEKKIISDALLEEINVLKEKVSSYRNNSVLEFTNEELEEINQIIDSCDSKKLNQISQIFLEKYKVASSNISKELNAVELKIKEEESQKEEIERLKENIEKIFDTNLEESETKDYLQKNNVEAKYFYEVIKFRDNVPENTRKYLEKSLKAMGILQAFLVKDAKNTMVDLKSLEGGKEVKDSILEYFDITDKNYENSVISILKSISKKDGEISIQDGTYKMGLIRGRLNNSYDLKYIGEEKRKEFKKTRLKEYDVQIEEINERIIAFTHTTQKLNEAFNVLEKEYNNPPHFTRYNELLDNLKAWDAKLEMIRLENLQNEEGINHIKKEIKLVQDSFDEAKNHYRGPISLKEITEVITNFGDFRNLVIALKNNKNGYEQALESLETYKNHQEELLESMDDLRSELSEISYEMKNIQNKISRIEELMNSDQYKNIKLELEKLKAKEDELNNEKETNLVRITTNKKDIDSWTDKLQELEKSIKENEAILKVKEEIFKEELGLGYSSYQEECTDTSKWFRNFKIDKVMGIQDAYDRLTDAISKYIPKLQNYAGRKVYILTHEEEQNVDFVEDKELASKIFDLYENAKRSDLEFRYSGKNVNLIELNEALELESERTTSLLKDEDRKLFEDLLMNNIGESIRKKITSSNEWILEVRNLMESMNTSSGLSFSIKWRGKAKESESEMDTSEIVKLLMKDPDSLKEEDFDKVTDHFRSKIALEEEKYEESERNYLEIIRNVLDYRKWFEFSLEFKRTSMPKKELTDKEFSKFSGGEKAIAMYVPLFAGIYAKFNAAKKDAPRVIALDEAFAGVDDDNILDCFRILESMDIDYVMTSQILWGDYNTIKHLAISELHHPIGSDVVSILKYKWDGIKRSLVTDEKEYQE